MPTSLQRIDKNTFVTETMLMLAKFGDYLGAVESSMESLKMSGLNDVLRAFSQNGRLKSKEAKKLFSAHSKRFDRDMGRFGRYSAASTLYSIFEVRSRAFMEDFKNTYPGKPESKKFLAKSHVGGFVGAFQSWLETPPAAVHFPKQRMWILLRDFQLIRNCIVHGHGDCNLVKDPQRISEAIRRTRKACLNTDGILILEREFVFEVCERIYTFFRLLFHSSGYGLSLPPGHAEMLAKSFAGFETEIAKKCAEYDAMQTINLGGRF